MERLKQLPLIRLLRKGEKGVTTVEYALMLVLVALVVAIGAPNFATNVLAVFTAMTTHLNLPAA